jgi:hypothetical protein
VIDLNNGFFVYADENNYIFCKGKTKSRRNFLKPRYYGTLLGVLMCLEKEFNNKSFAHLINLIAETDKYIEYASVWPAKTIDFKNGFFLKVDGNDLVLCEGVKRIKQNTFSCSQKQKKTIRRSKIIYINPWFYRSSSHAIKRLTNICMLRLIMKSHLTAEEAANAYACLAENFLKNIGCLKTSAS